MRIRTESSIMLDCIEWEYTSQDVNKRQLRDLLLTVSRDIHMINQQISVFNAIAQCKDAEFPLEMYLGIRYSSDRLVTVISETGLIVASSTDEALQIVWAMIVNTWQTHRKLVLGLDVRNVEVANYLNIAA